MPTTTKIPAFPTPADIARELANIAPGRDRYRTIWQAANQALELTEIPADPLAELANHAATTGDIPTPEQMLDAARATLDQDRDRRQIRGTLESVRQRFVTAPEVTTEQAHEILGYLADNALPAVLDAVRALPADAPLTAEDALDYGAKGADTYRTTVALVAAYEAIRQHQRKAVSRIAASSLTSADWTTMVAHSGIVRDATESDPHWLRIRRAQLKQFGSGLRQYAEAGNDHGALEYFQATPEHDQWPAIPERAAWPEKADDHEQRARWLIRATRDLELWVPTFDQLNTEHRENQARVAVQSWIGATTRKSWMVDRLGRTRITEVSSVAGIATSTRTAH